jgi:hypothetical protein
LARQRILSRKGAHGGRRTALHKDRSIGSSIYDDDAIEGSDANEEPLGFDPLEGDWRVSLPCLPDDLSWVQTALMKHSTRITAREPDDEVAKAEATQASQASALVFDRKGFLGS